jgi:hypothetical protein
MRPKFKKFYCFVFLIFCHFVFSHQESLKLDRRYQIGDFAQGGVVIWVTDEGQHGLVVAIEDATQGAKWYKDSKPPFPETRAWSNLSLPLKTIQSPLGADYGGYENQKRIEAEAFDLSDYPAFHAAASYRFTFDEIIYDDWFLPSSTELALIWALKEMISKVSCLHGGSALLEKVNNPAYWSSLEFKENPHYAWLLHFSTGFHYHLGKDHLFAVRCVRAF